MNKVPGWHALLHLPRFGEGSISALLGQWQNNTTIATIHYFPILSFNDQS